MSKFTVFLMVVLRMDFDEEDGEGPSKFSR